MMPMVFSSFLIFIIYAFLFYYSGNAFYFLLSILSIGFLLAFLRYNISKNKRIFMGDTGSLTVGFLIGVLTIRFLAMPDIMLEMIWVKPIHKFLVVGAIIFFPIADVLRVIIMRLINRRSPFSPDRSHMHHILVDKGLLHKKASFTLTVCGGIIFGIIYFLSTSIGSWALTWVLIGFYLMTFSILLMLDYDKNSIFYRRRFKAKFPRRFQKLEFRLRKKVIIVLKKLFYKDLL